MIVLSRHCRSWNEVTAQLRGSGFPVQQLVVPIEAVQQDLSPIIKLRREGQKFVNAREVCKSEPSAKIQQDCDYKKKQERFSTDKVSARVAFAKL